MWPSTIINAHGGRAQHFARSDWKAVQRAIESMGDNVREQPVWRYWRARALQASGKRVAANAIFLALSREYDYYSQLAQEELGPVMQCTRCQCQDRGR